MAGRFRPRVLGLPEGLAVSPTGPSGPNRTLVLICKEANPESARTALVGETLVASGAMPLLQWRRCLRLMSFVEPSIHFVCCIHVYSGPSAQLSFVSASYNGRWGIWHQTLM